MKMTRTAHISLLFFSVFFLAVTVSAQVLYTARGYWEESTKKTYRQLKLKQQASDSLSQDEQAYILDYEVYLTSYFNRLSPEEKVKYDQMKPVWDNELKNAIPPSSAEVKEFEWRNRDRFVNALYGVYYGSTLVAITGIDNAAAVGIPLITGGMWLLGPALNSKKYEGITEGTIRMSSTGKLLGLVNGLAFGLAIGGDSDAAGDLALGFSTVGSIALGEVAFQLHKKKNYSDGYIEMMRHYGLLGPLTSLSIAGAADVDNAHVLGLSILAGSAGGLIIGNKVAKKYDYTRGDVDAVSSLSLISTGLGFAFVTEAYYENDAPGLLLIPAASSILGTIWGQRSVKGLSLTKKQGSTINLSTAGAALVGLGVVSFTQSDKAGVWIGVPSGLALVTHQLLMQHFRKKNLEARFEGRQRKKSGMQLSMNFTPEGILVNKKITTPDFNTVGISRLHQSVVSLKLKL